MGIAEQINFTYKFLMDSILKKRQKYFEKKNAKDRVRLYSFQKKLGVADSASGQQPNKRLNLEILKVYKSKAIKKIKHIQTKKLLKHLKEKSEQEVEENGEGTEKGSSLEKKYQMIKKRYHERLRKRRKNQTARKLEIGDSVTKMHPREFRLSKKFKESTKMVSTIHGKMSLEDYKYLVHPQSKVFKPKNWSKDMRKQIKEHHRTQKKVLMKYRGDPMIKARFRRGLSTGPLTFNEFKHVSLPLQRVAENFISV